MKQFACNSHQLSILPPASERAAAQFEGSSRDIKQSFHGCDAVNQDLASSMREKRKTTIAVFNQSQRPLTSIDSIRVDRATVREGKTHRHWPREVVEKFLAAEVIRGKRRKSREPIIACFRLSDSQRPGSS